MLRKGLILIALLLVYFLSGQRDNIINRTENKTDVIFVLKPLELSLAGLDFGSPLALVTRRQVRAQLSVLRVEEDNLVLKATNSIVSEDGYIVGQDKFIKGSKMRLLLNEALVDFLVLEVEEDDERA